MNLNISGHHVDLTDSLRDFVTSKMSKIERHFDHIIDADVVLEVEKEKIRHKAEATLHASGKTRHAEAVEDDMYTAIDGMIDKLDRQTRRFKEKLKNHHAKGPQRIAETLQ